MTHNTIVYNNVMFKVISVSQEHKFLQSDEIFQRDLEILLNELETISRPIPAQSEEIKIMLVNILVVLLLGIILWLGFRGEPRTLYIDI